jgi:hypothetical protein
MKNAKNIIDSFDLVNIELLNPIDWNGAFKLFKLEKVKIIQFDIIGFTVDYLGIYIFIPWSNVQYVMPILPEVTEEESECITEY